MTELVLTSFDRNIESQFHFLLLISTVRIVSVLKHFQCFILLKLRHRALVVLVGVCVLCRVSFGLCHDFCLDLLRVVDLVLLGEHLLDLLFVLFLEHLLLFSCE